MNILRQFFKKPKTKQVPYKIEPKYTDEHEECFTQSHGCLSYDNDYNAIIKHKALKDEQKR